MKRFMFLFLTLLLLFSMPVQAAKLNKKKITLNAKKSITLKVKGAKGKVTWKSSNKKVATVSKKGVVKALKRGTCKITAKVKNKKYKCKVTVKQPVEAIRITTAKVAEVPMGALYRAKIVVLPSNANNKKLTYKSSNTKVARVNSSGTVTPVSVGKAVITVTAKDGSKKKNSFTVKVIKKTGTSTTASTSKVTKEQLERTLHDFPDTFTFNSEEGTRMAYTRTSSNVGIVPRMVGASYSVSDSSVMTIPETGKITFHKGGTVEVKLTADDNSSVYVKKTVKVINMADYYKTVPCNFENLNKYVGFSRYTFQSGGSTDAFGNTTPIKQYTTLRSGRKVNSEEFYLLRCEKNAGVKYNVFVTYENGEQKQLSKEDFILSGESIIGKDQRSDEDYSIDKIVVNQTIGNLRLVNKKAVLRETRKKDDYGNNYTEVELIDGSKMSIYNCQVSFQAS